DAASRSRGEADRGHGSDGPDMTHMVHRRRSADRRRRCMKRALDANTSDPPSAGARRTTAASVVQCLCMTALYQRARPVTFGEVVGQDHVKEVLVSAVRRGRTGHAYLFSGPRGVGKTTSARLLAMAVNCEAEDPADRP